MQIEQSSIFETREKVLRLRDEEGLDLVSVVVAVVLELIGVELVVQLLGNEDHDVTERRD